MDSDTGGQSRRSVLKAAAGLGGAGVLTTLAGCSSVENAIGMGSGGGTGSVPEDAESVYTIEAGAIVEDEAVTTLADAYLEMRAEVDWYEGPEDYEEALDEFEDETGLDATMAGTITAFSEYSDYGVASEYAGMIFTGEWEQDDVVDAYEDNYEADEEEYEGKTIYEPDGEYQPAMAILGDNRYVVGRLDAVEDVIDVEGGDEDGLDSELQSAFDSTRDAPIRYAGEGPSWIDTGEVEQNGESVDTEPLDDVDFVSGAVYKSGEAIGVETTMHAEDEEVAADIVDVVEGIIAITENDEYTAEIIKEEVGEVGVERDGSNVVLTYQKDVSEIEDAIEEQSESTRA